MATSYPGGIDAFTNPSATDSLASATVPHATQHANANDAIEAIETELGTNPKGASASVKARLDTLDTTVSGKAPSASPTFTGTVTTPLTTAGYVKTSAGGVLSSSAAIAQADVTNLTSDLAGKAPTASPTFTGVALFADGSVGAPSIANDGDPDTGVYFPSANEIALVTAGVERLKIDANGIFTGGVGSLDAWTAYTPSLGGTGWAIGDGTATGKYTRIGKRVMFYTFIQFGASSTFGAGQLTVSLPLAVATFNAGPAIAARLRDASAAANYVAVGAPGGSALTMFALSGAFQMSSMTSTAPFAWAASDYISILGIYETSA